MQKGGNTIYQAIVIVCFLLLLVIPGVNSEYISVDMNAARSGVISPQDPLDVCGVNSPYFEVYELMDFGQTAWGLTSGDFDNDGLLDFAVSSATAPFEFAGITLFYNNGDMNFTQDAVFKFDYSYITDLNSGDYDNDGDVDLLFSYSEHENSVNSYGIVSMALNDGTNHFDDEVMIAKRGSGNSNDIENRINPSLTTGDYNDDGSLDFLMGDNSGKVELFINDGGGGFTSADIIYDFGFLSWGLGSGDFNKDGTMDFIVLAEEQNGLIRRVMASHVYLKYNNGLSSCFDQDEGDIIVDLSGGSGCLTTLDYDNDGDLDIIMGRMNPYIYNNHNGRYEGFFIYDLPNSPEGYGDALTLGAIASGDFNKDGREDFVAGGVQGVVRLFINSYGPFPPTPPSIDGRYRGLDTGIEYDYTFSAVDLNEDDVYLNVEWGDGTTTGWIGPYSSGQEIVLPHSWEEEGTYLIRAKAKDINEAESDWSTHSVSTPKTRTFDTLFLRLLAQRFHLLSILQQGVFLENVLISKHLPFI